MDIYEYLRMFKDILSFYTIQVKIQKNIQVYFQKIL